jgi:hypothetical protein
LGWLTVLLVFACTFALAVRFVHPFLAVSVPVGGRFLIVEGWMPPEEIKRVVDIFRQGQYQRVITTGGPVPAWLEDLAYVSHAVLARDYLVRQGLPEGLVTAVPAPASAQDRTFLSAVMVREWMQTSGIAADSFDLVSSDVHSRRSWVLYRTAFGPRFRIGIIALPPSTYDSEAWWNTSAGAKTVLSEALSWLWTVLYFRPASSGSHAEKWGGPGPGLPAAEQPQS